MQYQLLVSFVVYLVVILAIGLIASYRAMCTPTEYKNTDFLLGNRSTHWLLTSLSAHAADMSDWLFMALPATVYLHGGNRFWIPVGLLCGMYAAWQWVAVRLRVASEHYRGVTMASFFSNRFADTTGMLSLLAALISLFFLLVYIAAGLKGMGFVLESAFDIPYHVGITVSVFVVVLYTCIGGFATVALLDLFQGLFLLSVIMLVPVVAYLHVGGIQTIVHAAAVRGVSLAPLESFDFRTIMGIILDPLAWGLGYFGMPHILTKFMGTKDASELHKAKYVGLLWQLLALTSAVCVGVVAIAYFVDGIPGKPEFLFISMTQQLFTPWVAGIILCAVVAATISTVDSQVLVIASVLTNDVYNVFVQKNASQKQLFVVYRCALVIAACGGLAIAWPEGSTIMSLVKYGWGGLGASFGPLMLIALYSGRVNNYGAIAAMMTGCIVAAGWDFVAPLITTMTIYAIVPAFVASFVAAYIGTWLTTDACCCKE